MLIIFNAAIHIQKVPPPHHLVPQLFYLAFIPYSKGSKRNAQLPNDPSKGGFTLLSINVSVSFPPWCFICYILFLSAALSCSRLSMTHNPFISLCISLPLCVAGYSCTVLLTVLCPGVTLEGRVFQVVLGSKRVI